MAEGVYCDMVNREKIKFKKMRNIRVKIDIFNKRFCLHLKFET